MIACDLIHEVDALVPAEWALIGEGGDYYICDEHYRMVSRDQRPTWKHIEQ